MDIYRIAQEKYADDLSGNGAWLYGGRWNSEGFYVIYAASSRSLALLEILAHTPSKMLRENEYSLITLSIQLITPHLKIEHSQLQAGWNAPDIRLFTQKTGDQFLTGQQNLLLSVPSVIVPEENNFLINPNHMDMKKVKISFKRKISFDNRIGENL